jgi:hypothetical protein
MQLALLKQKLFRTPSNAILKEIIHYFTVLHRIIENFVLHLESEFGGISVEMPCKEHRLFQFQSIEFECKLTSYKSAFYRSVTSLSCNTIHNERQFKHYNGTRNH